MDTLYYKTVEFFMIYILLPVSFIFSYLIWIKLAIGLFGFIYILYVLLRVERKKIEVTSNPNWKVFWLQTGIKFMIISVITTFFIWFTDKESLFVVFLNKPKLWIFILFVYSIFSVYPQELIYRTFYFQRYEGLFKNKALFFFTNAIVFAFGHLFFRNTLVIMLTFLGGLLFALTYNKSRSTLLVSIEHAIYGSWLFTVGMGSILGFPI